MQTHIVKTAIADALSILANFLEETQKVMCSNKFRTAFPPTQCTGSLNFWWAAKGKIALHKPVIPDILSHLIVSMETWNFIPNPQHVTENPPLLPFHTIKPYTQCNIPFEGKHPDWNTNGKAESPQKVLWGVFWMDRDVGSPTDIRYVVCHRYQQSGRNTDPVIRLPSWSTVPSASQKHTPRPCGQWKRMRTRFTASLVSN